MKHLLSLLLTFLLGMGIVFAQEVTKPVYNETTGVGYETLDAAWDAAASGDVLLLNEDVTVSTRRNCNNRDITIRSNGNTTHSIIRAQGNTGNMLFLSNSSSCTLTLENVIIDGNDISSTVSILEASSSGLVNLINVEVKDAKTSKDQGFFCIKNNGKLSVNGLKLTNSAVTYEGRGDIFVGSNSVDIQGLCEFSVFVEKTYPITDNGLLKGSNVTLLFDTSRANNADNPLVKNATAASYYKCGIDGYKFNIFDDNLTPYELTAELPQGSNAVVNETTGKGYSNLVAAWNAAQSDDVLVLNETATVTERLNSNERNITIKSNENSQVTITRGDNYNGLLFLTNHANDIITLENLAIDEENTMTDGSIIEAGNNGTFTLKDVKLLNGASHSGQGLIVVKNGGHLNINNLEIKGSNIPEGCGEIFAGTNNIQIGGICSFSLYIDEANFVTDSGVTDGSTIKTFFNTEKRGDNVLVTGVQSESSYVCGVEDYKFTFDNNGNMYAKSTLIPEIPENTKPVYNSTSDKGFETLAAAWNAANSDDVLILNEPATISEGRLNSDGRTITITSKDGSMQTITRGDGFDKLLFLSNNGNGSNGKIILDNVILDNANSSFADMVESSHNGVVELNNVVVRNAVGKNFISEKESGGNGTLIINGLSFEDCTVEEGKAEVSFNKGSLIVAGECNFSIQYDTQNSVEDNGVAEGSKITLIFDPTTQGDNVLVTGVKSESSFVCGVEDYELTFDANGNAYAQSTIVPAEPEDTKPVYNSTSEKGFETLAAAWNSANSGDVLILNQDATITKDDGRLNSNGRTITITSKEGTTQSIIRGEGNSALMFLPTAGEETNGEIILENVILDGNNVENCNPIIECSQNGSITLNNVVVRNAIGNESAISVRESKGNGHLTLNGLTIEEGSGILSLADASDLSMEGVCNFTLNITSTHSAVDNGVAEGSEITLLFNADIAADKVLVEGVESADNYICGVEDFELKLEEGNLYAVSTIEPENPDVPDDPEDPEDTKPVYNPASGKGFDSLAAAWKAAENNDVLILNEPAVVDERLNSDSRNITIKSNGDTPMTIKRGNGYNGILFLTTEPTDGAEGNSITLENVIIDEENTLTPGSIIEAGNHGTVTLTDVKIINGATDNGQGLVAVKNGGKLIINNLDIEGSTIPEGRGEIFAGTNGIQMSGRCNFSLFLEGSNHAADNGITEGQVKLHIDADERNLDAAVITGADSLDRYVCATSGHKLNASEDGIYIAKEGTTGIEAADYAEDSTVTVYTLQGQLVKSGVSAAEARDGLNPGIYIISGKKMIIK